MSHCRNLDSANSRPEFTLPMTPREMERHIAHLYAKIAMLEIQVEKLSKLTVTKNYVKELISRRLGAAREDQD